MVSRNRRNLNRTSTPPSSPPEPEPEPEPTADDATRQVANRLGAYDPEDRERVLALVAPLIILANGVRAHHADLADQMLQLADTVLLRPEAALESADLVAARIEDVRAVLREEAE